jgi:hypothetical protein
MEFLALKSAVTRQLDAIAGWYADPIGATHFDGSPPTKIKGKNDWGLPSPKPYGREREYRARIENAKTLLDLMRVDRELDAESRAIQRQAAWVDDKLVEKTWERDETVTAYPQYRQVIERGCKGCGEKFVPKRRDQQYHNTACKQRAYRGRLNAAA